MKSISLILVALFLAPVLTSAAEGHRLFSMVLRDHVQAGRVDYEALAVDGRLVEYLDYLNQTRPAELASEEERIALWINAYNAYTLKLVSDAYPIESIHDLGTGGRLIGWLINRSPWDIRFAKVGGEEYTLNEIEHEILRVRFDEPRIHFAVVCAAVSCPPLRAEAYFPERLDAQLDEQGRSFLHDTRHNRFDAELRTAEVSKIFSWFAKDFGDDDEAILKWIAGFAPHEIATSMAKRPEDWSLSHLSYDWSLNDQR